MKVYIEYVVINNLAINFLLLYWALVLCGRRAVFWRLLLASALGTVAAVFEPYLNFAGAVAIKLALPFAMCILAANPVSIKKYLTFFGALMVFTALLGGAVYLLFNLGQAQFVLMLDFKNSLLSAVIAVLCALFTYFARFITYKSKCKKRKDMYECEVEIKISGTTLKAKGFFDSGNKLYASATCPVIFIDKSIMPDTDKLKKKKLHVNTVNSTAELEAFRLDRLTVGAGKGKRVFDEVFACVSERNMQGYQVILHSDM